MKSSATSATGPTEQYRGALAEVYGLERSGIKLGIERMGQALAASDLRDPRATVIHVAGTNGKGSTAAMIAKGLQAAGHRVGRFTSPHLHRFGERICVDDEPLSDASLVTLVRELKSALREHPMSFFESALWMALAHFRAQRCDHIVLEVGLGGRLDATNAVKSDLSVITHVGLDHTGILGETIAAIAEEKAGIIRSHTPVICGDLDPQAKAVVHRVARERQAPLRTVPEDGQVRVADGQITFRSRDRVVEGVRPSLHGVHQRNNIACALLALGERLPLAADTEPLRAAVEHTRWPGRLEHLSAQGGTTVLLDAAHNLSSCETLLQHLRADPLPTPRVLVFGAARDKPAPAMLNLLAPAVDAVVLTTPPVARGLAAEELLAEFQRRTDTPVTVEATPRAAWAQAAQRAGSHGSVVVAGSIFVMAPIRAQLLELHEDPPIAM